MKFFNQLVFGLGLIVLVSCQSRPGDQLGVNKRISQNADQFSNLNSEERSLVGGGDISKGMSEDAVRLAWGAPDDISYDGDAKKWSYYSNRPQATAAQPTRYGIGKYFSSSSKYYDDNTSHTEVPSVEVLERTVTFYNDKVQSWTRVRNQ